MPVTLNIVDHPATGWRSPKVSSSNALLREACRGQYKRCQRIVQCSFDPTSLRKQHITASENGFVWAAYHAYSDHHHLIIRPEDVWFAILTQISFYINAHAEELRTFFVRHEGQKELNITSEIRDFGRMAQEMTELISKHVVDPDLRDWVMPSFSTTTDCDRTVGAVLFMGAMKAYFKFSFTLACGIPSVTLLGEVEDWQEIMRRIDKLELLGDEPTVFAKMLRPILSHIILSFEDPLDKTVVRFWNTIAHKCPRGSGPRWLSGWLTAFCFWDEEGNSKPFPVDRDPEGRMRRFHLGGVLYPLVDLEDVPLGIASVPVRVNDMGCMYEATMVAGSVGTVASSAALSSPPSSSTEEVGTARSAIQSSNLLDVSSQGEEAPADSSDQIEPGTRIEILDTVQPLSGWWMFENTSDEGEIATVGKDEEIGNSSMGSTDCSQEFRQVCLSQGPQKDITAPPSRVSD
ncbi:hypothetical protein N0V82_004050 [Gnomoniopsis sp. IMI 355080]|nr:hypothetical protein N0V82_004050 [Gnomoniopsis sp. IMI 355080]